MKKMIFALAVLLTATLCAEGHRNTRHNHGITMQTFYDELSPYGEWIYTNEYGHVWRPYTEPMEDFRPYATSGNWVFTDLGWTWVSDYRWGWATFHYGRWYFDDYLGWMWIPGYEWAPAWVTWGSYNDNWAWAPMGPEFHVNIQIDWHPPVFWWTFLPRRHFCATDWYAHCYTPPVHVTNITYITNIYNNRDDGHGKWYYGPRVKDVERHARKRVERVDLVDADQPGKAGIRDSKLNIYRPDVTRDGSKRAQPAYARSKEQIRVGAKDGYKIEQNREPVAKRSVEGMVKRHADPIMKSTPAQKPSERKKDQTIRKADERRTPAPPVKVSNARGKGKKQNHEKKTDVAGKTGREASHTSSPSSKRN
jgi:hypothetical protein